MSRQPPPDPITTVLVVMAYVLVATSTPGATSVKLRTEPVYHLAALLAHRPAAKPARTSAALRIGRVHEALHRAHHAGRVFGDDGDLRGRRTRRQGRDGALECVNRGRDGAGFAREVALGRVDQRGGVALDLRELRFHSADPAAGQPLDRILEIGPVRAVSRLAATAAGERDGRGCGGKDQGNPYPGVTLAGSRFLVPGNHFHSG